MSRLAARNCGSVCDFGLDMGVPFATAVAGDAGALDRQARLAGVPTGEIEAWSPTSAGNRTPSLRGESFHARALMNTTVRGCPLCLREDAQASDCPSAQAMAIRGHWMPRPVTLCLCHRHALVPLWKEPDPGRRYDLPARFAEIAPAVTAGAFDRVRRDLVPFDYWVEQRLTTGRGHGWIDRFALYRAAHFCEGTRGVCRRRARCSEDDRRRCLAQI